MPTGQCLCGKVQYELTGELSDVRLCYCELCRRANGTVFSANARFPSDQYQLVSGRDIISEYESSPGAFRAFCINCGSPVYARVTRDPDHIRVRLGTLSPDAKANITAHVWVGAKPSWYEITDELPQYERGTDGPLIEKP